MASTLKRLNEVYPSDVKSTVPLALRVNDVLYTTSLNASDPVTGEISGDFREQMRKTLQKLKDMVEKAGGSLDNVARCVCYTTMVEYRDPAEGVWEEMFSNDQDRPANKILLGELPEGQLFCMDALVLLGERRTRIDIPNVRAHDPTIKIGNWVISSRCHGNSQENGQIVEGGLEPEAKQALINLSTLIKLAGGSDANFVQINTYGREPEYLAAARAAFEAHFPDASKRPAFNQHVNFVGLRQQVAMDFFAVL